MSDSTLPNKGLNPVERTIEDRSVDLGNVEAQASQDEHRHRRDGFIYEISLRNDADKGIRGFSLRYVPVKGSGTTADSANPARRIVCEEKIGSRSSRLFKIFSLLPPSETVSANAAERERAQGDAGDIIVDHLVFTDGSEWNRSDDEAARGKTPNSSHKAPGTNCILY